MGILHSVFQGATLSELVTCWVKGANPLKQKEGRLRYMCNEDMLILLTGNFWLFPLCI